MKIEINNRKIINAWCSYDIANSAYNLIITSALFPVYYQIVTKQSFLGEMVSIWGMNLKSSVLYTYTISIAYLIILCFTPLLSGIADYVGRRKRFMQFFTLIGSISCFSLYWFTGTNLEFGIVMIGLAVIGYSGSVVFYNSFLPQIATPDRHDKISSRGFALGYLGSVTLLAFIIIMIEKYEFFGFSGKLQVMRFGFLMVGVWWILISQIAFYYLKDFPIDYKLSKRLVLKGVYELIRVFRKMQKNKSIKIFLPAFFFYSMGVQTIMLVAAMFAESEIHITGAKLIQIIFILQFLGIIGSILFGRVSMWLGNKTSIIIMLFIWIGVSISAYFIQTEGQFMILAGSVGLVMGGIQSQSRSTFSKLIPQNTRETASYFSFYDTTEKITIVLGMALYGFIDQVTGNMRIGSAILGIFFLIGLVIIFNIRLEKPAKVG